MLKSVTKSQFLKNNLATPSRVAFKKAGLGKSASMSNLPEMAEEMESGIMEEETGVGEESTANLQSEEKLADMSSVSASFQKLPSRSPGSNDGAALLTLREQEKVIIMSG